MLAHDHVRQLLEASRRSTTTHRFEVVEQRLAELTDELRSTSFTLLQRLERVNERVHQCCARIDQCQRRIDALERRGSA